MHFGGNVLARRLNIGTLGIVIPLALGLAPQYAPGQASILVDPPVIAPVNSLSITDLNFSTSTTPQWLFSIGMRTSDGTTVAARMSFRIGVTFPDGVRYDDAFVLDTKPPHFQIPGSRTVTNIDFGRTIPTEKAVVNPQARARLEAIALPSGVIPAGMYDFSVSVTPLNGGESGHQDFTITLSNPSSLTLLFPPDGEASTGPTPLFQWLYDGDSSRISVYERLPGQNSNEEAASGVAILTRTVREKTFQYPSGGVRALAPGRSYVWFVEGLAAGTGGASTAVRSELRSFTVTTGGAGSLTALLDQIERSLGPNYHAVFDEIRASALTPDGTMRLNNAVVSLPDVLRLLERIRNSPDGVTSVVLE